MAVRNRRVSAAPDREDAERWYESHAGLLFSLAGIVLTLAIFASISPLRHSVLLTAHGNLSGLRSYIRGLHFEGFALLFSLFILHAIVPYISEILTTTSGFVYGFVPGALFAIVGWTCSGLVSYGIGATVGRPLLRRVLGAKFTRLEAIMDDGGTQLLLVYRLVPVVPYSLLGYVAGATSQPLWRFVWTSFVGYLPLTVAVAYLGSQAKSLSVENPAIWAVVVLMIVLLVLSRVVGRRAAQRASRSQT